MSKFSEYLTRVAAWTKAGYYFSYKKSAELAGMPGLGLLEPFHALARTIRGAHPHRVAEDSFDSYRFLTRYSIDLDDINQDFIMRPVANVGAILGGIMGALAGSVLAIAPQITPRNKTTVTEGNKYFTAMKIDAETRQFSGVLVWAGLAGLGIGMVLGRSFQGALGLAELASLTAGFTYKLPELVRNTWHYAQKLGTMLKDSAVFILTQLRKLREYVGKELGIFIEEAQKTLELAWKKICSAANYVSTQVSAGMKKIGNFVSGCKDWSVKQAKFIFDKINGVVTVIREQGIKGLIEWVKDKTIGAVLRYIDSLNQIGRLTSEIRGVVESLLSTENKEKSNVLFELISKDFQVKDKPSDKTAQLNVVMNHIELIAENHRANAQHGSIKNKLDYLENLKIDLDKLTKLEVTKLEVTEVKELKAHLDPAYRSWTVGYDAAKLASNDAESAVAPTLSIAAGHANKL